MHEAVGISIQNWYLIDAIDIRIKGTTALVGPTGAGKSSIQDAIQTVMTGCNHNRLNLNPSASGRSQRSVLDYCLGWTKDPSEGGKPLRESCESVIALVFEDSVTREPITIGVALSARHGDSREEVLSRFIAPGYAYSVNHAKRRVGSKEVLMPWAEILDMMKKKCPRLEEFKSSAEKFTAEVLRIMRTEGQPPNPKHFLRAFSNALAFKPIFDPTVFVREFILEQDDLDIERVRISIATWQELERLIEQTENRLRRVARLSDRFRTWGRSKVRAEGARFTAATAELRRVGHDVRTYKEQVSAKSGLLSRERTALQTRKQWVAELDDEIRSKTALAQASGDAAFTRQLELEKQHFEREMKMAHDRLLRIRKAVGSIAQLAPVRNDLGPKHGRAIEAARELVNMLPEHVKPEDVLRQKGEKAQRLVDEILSLEEAHAFLHQHIDQLSDEVRTLQSDIERLEGIANSGSDNVLLSSHTMNFMQALERRGIGPTVLCDVVDVVDEQWRDAVESLLGRGREAIIVPPDRVEEAHDTMQRESHRFAGCTLVATNDPDIGAHRYEPGSILEAVYTDNKYAAAFMAVRIGGYQKAETNDDMRRLKRGVMKNGKTKSGMGLSVTPVLRERMLGRAAKDHNSEALRNELALKHNQLIEKRGKLMLLREASRILPTAIDQLKDGDGPFHLEHQLRSLAQKLTDLKSSQLEAAQSSSASRLLEDIAYAEEQRTMYLTEIAEEIEPNVYKLQQELATASAKLEAALEAYKRAFKERQKIWQTLSSAETQKLLMLDPEIDEPDAHKLLKRIRFDLKRGEAERTDAKGYLSGVRNDQKVIADNSESEARREQNGAVRELSEYAVAWSAEVPQIDHDTMTVGYAWVIGEKAKLEGNELRKHQKECERAANEMRKLLKEDLLARLAEKLVKVGHKLDQLNSRLSKHHFTRQVYTFTSAVNPRFQKMHDLAIRFATTGDENVVNLDANDIAEAVQELEGLIQGNEGTQRLADYREYFTFEIIMTDQNGGRTSMSTRAVKGSGGEAQAPFYVAMAASLSSAYFPGHTVGEPTGMGLAMFDEAFNKLDVANTQNLLTFFRDMGLQLIIAGPEDKRATFTEVLDTIILVNKAPDGLSVYIDAEYPGEMARMALASINPDHGGVEAFRVAS